MPEKSVPTQPELPSPHRPYFLMSRRLGFGCWSQDDLPLALSLWGDPQVTSLIGGPFDAEHVKLRLEREISWMNLYNVQYWPVFLLNTHRHAGCAGLRPYRIEEHIYELGFHFTPEFWGQGLAGEAGATVIRYAFDVLRARSLFAGHHPSNHASRRVLLRLGFTLTHEEFYPPTGLKHPSYLLRSS